MEMVSGQMLFVSCVYLFSMLSLFATKKNSFRIIIISPGHKLNCTDFRVNSTDYQPISKRSTSKSFREPSGKSVMIDTFWRAQNRQYCHSCQGLSVTPHRPMDLRCSCTEGYDNHRQIYFEQESPPAWTQEEYRPPCSKYSLCCPNWIPPWQGTPPAPQPGYPPGQGTPLGRVPPSPARVPPRPGYPPARVPPRPGYPPWPGYPPSWTWQGTPPAAPWHSGKCCKALWDTGIPPVDKLTKWNYYLPVVLRTRAVIIIQSMLSRTLPRKKWQ